MRKKISMRREHLGVIERKNVAYLEFMAGRTIPEMRANMTPLPQKRAPRSAPDPNDNEADVLSAVGELLHVHPKVLLAVRQNSGAAQYDNGAGRAIPIWFYRIVRKPVEMTIVDYWGFLADGRPFAFECKRPSWSHPRTEREMKQWAYINTIVKLGGVGSFVKSVDEVAALLR